MKIQDVLRKEVMIMDLQATTKEAAIDEMISNLVDKGIVTDFDTFKEGIMNREAQTSTGLGDGIAMPHSKNAAVKEATVLFAKSAKGVDYESLDGQPTDLFFMIAAPDGANDTHLAALAELSKYLMKDGFADKLRQVTSPDEVIATFDAAEEENKAEAASKAAPVTDDDKPLVVAVTACTTGIAHTYMAEEALIKQGQEMGVNVRVETNGASGVGTPLTADEIKRAKGVIVAADKAVEMPRFDGKPLISRPVAEGIKKPEELINTILDGKAETYHAAAGEASTAASDSGEKTGLGAAFYKHLMSGVSQMLPFVIGGGIITAISFLIDNFMGVPQSHLSDLGHYHAAAAIFNQIGGAAFFFMLPILAGYIAYSIAEKPGLVAGVTAGYIAKVGYAINMIGADESKLIPSGFLGALVGGFLAGGVALLLKKYVKVPRSLEGIKSILLLPLLGVGITGFLMLLVNVPMGAINTALSNFLEGLSGSSALLLGLIVGAMMAIDMGGPFNKAAYVFATGTLADPNALAHGGTVVMAAVMAGGMVPPLAVFVATRLFPQKFNKEERDSGLTNIVMGLSFITEGAIPFGAADPGRAIPSFMLGSAITGALVGAAGIKLLAPHGGIFVIALTTNWWLYLIFVAIGAIISGVVFGALRKEQEA
ncbi:PTS fructose transporter subunit IIABC [Streptococcus sobrinus]|uniref:PTS fructose transporter subunit IIC n=8 Tax=Streptococcus sobrinus TaxID=1310 RepID=A0ABM6W5X2_9STRE|nr:fructose-specific PTS transporter subunit EIIC [Streptococcus sobrinus]AWN20890.1 PTS fructose transporter subunit IIC [Streptococcus sobrinus]EMP70041.1 PTS system fructose-specific transporter subunit IIABC [Streptococcus sobrinus DSM 20742 = ATCC 33478]ERJ76435.1 putative PTS system fructose-specific EIIABC component [Streptococcus sobrinus W1703]SQG13666.1 PTS system fructose-specific transporter subunit IIABC [Streptococcus sobrinus]